jgi:hypothetical protein
MKRKTPLLMAGDARTSVPVFKPRKCDARKGGCGETFKPTRQMQVMCGGACALSHVAWLNAKKAEKAAKDDRKATREKLDGMKKLGELRAEAQQAFNRYIRLRDQGKPCICCGEPLGDPRYGGAFDAGHFLSRGAHPNLAFDERNVNAQRKGCNRPGGTTKAKFTAGMIARYGAAVVDELEADQTPCQYRHDDYRQIKATYRAKARELEKERA